jgi:predicted lysophospholipase L1 biosynthesis ABC-type transport system permease subunit
MRLPSYWHTTLARFVIRQLLYDPVRTGLTSLALAAIVAVILLLEGFLEGVIEQSRNAVLNRGADLIVTQSGIKNLTLARSILPQSTRADVEAIEGVRVADPLTGIPVIYAQPGQRAPLLLFVYDASGGAHRLTEGAQPANPREIVVDRSFAIRFDLQVGDPVLISDFEFRLSGIAHSAAAFFSAFGFARYDDLIDFYFESDLAADISTFPLLSFLLVDLNDGADALAVAARIENAVPAADVFVPEDLASQDAALGRALLGPIFQILVAAGYLSGILVTGIIMFAAVNARTRDFGVLKALGFSQGFLTGSVVVEALLLAAFALSGCCSPRVSPLRSRHSCLSIECR